MATSYYIGHDHKLAFVDFPPVTRAAHLPATYVECPVCRGHGGWNLKVNAYPLHGRADTPENRHLFVHFRSHCGQCNGYGYTDDVNCMHVWQRERNIGNCLNEYACTKCGKISVVDSSD